MNKFILILFIFSSFSCSNKKFLNVKTQLNNCKIASGAKDAIINSIYRELNATKKSLKEIQNSKELPEKLSSRLKLCRKNFLDCRVSKDRQIEYNNILKKQIESEVCNGK